MSDFATLQDVLALSGKSYSNAEQQRIVSLLPLISDIFRNEAVKVGKDMDAMVAASASYASVAKLVTVDVVIRAIRQSVDGDPMTQESESAINYSWSGTYAIPGGGLAAAIMKNDLKRLGLRRQQYGVIEFYGQEAGDSPCF